MYVPESPSYDLPRESFGEQASVDSESHSQLIVCLGQPFHTFLLAQQHGGEYICSYLSARLSLLQYTNDNLADRYKWFTHRIRSDINMEPIFHEIVKNNIICVAWNHRETLGVNL